MVNGQLSRTVRHPAAAAWPIIRLQAFSHGLCAPGDEGFATKRVGLSGYREMLERDFRAIPDLYFDIRLLISEPHRVASQGRPTAVAPPTGKSTPLGQERGGG